MYEDRDASYAVARAHKAGDVVTARHEFTFKAKSYPAGTKMRVGGFSNAGFNGQRVYGHIGETPVYDISAGIFA